MPQPDQWSAGHFYALGLALLRLRPCLDFCFFYPLAKANGNAMQCKASLGIHGEQ